jgi:2-phospho-L-lactate guanylyltransferase
MLQDVLQTLSESRELAGLLVVTRDEEAASIARDYGARILAEKESLGHTAASTLGAQTLAREKKTGMLQVPADIPLVSPADIATLIEVHGTAPAITLAPSRDRTGSNAVLCSPADILPLQFGDYSFPPHVKKSQELGIEPVVVDRPGLGLDIDTPDDLVALLRAPSQTRSYRYLLASGIGRRLLDDAVAH